MIDLVQSFTLSLVATLGHLLSLGWWLVGRMELAQCRRTIYDLPISTQQMKRELRNSVYAPIHSVLLFFCLTLNLFRDTGVVSFLGSLLATALIAEIWHYFSHRAFHTKALLWIHKEHHKSLLSSPFSAISTSFTEKFIFSAGILGVLSAGNHFVDLNFYGIATWYILYITINSYTHANFELKPRSFLSGKGRFLTSTTYHSLHHARYINNFGLGTRILDRFFGTEWADYERVFDQVSGQGKPLIRHGEKLHASTDTDLG